MDKESGIRKRNTTGNTREKNTNGKAQAKKIRRQQKWVYYIGT
jgi:hypothetical protein